jgi:hypothetical protein
MSRESALRFLEACRFQPAMQREVGLLVDDARYDGLCAMAARHDFEFTPAELAGAFAIDWLACWAHFRRNAAKSDDQETYSLAVELPSKLAPGLLRLFVREAASP